VHVVEFGLQDLPKFLKEAGFEQVEQLNRGFMTVSFAWAKKPNI
jgi:hypothetical protein